jgi:hypothetical protein
MHAAAASSTSQTSSVGQSSSTAAAAVDTALNEYFVSVDIFLSKSAAAAHKVRTISVLSPQCPRIDSVPTPFRVSKYSLVFAIYGMFLSRN